MKFAVLVLCTSLAMGQSGSVRLEDLTWQEAAKELTPETVVLIPLGAASKEHGPHLKLSNDKYLADYFTAETMKRTKVVVAPLVNYSFYPAFVEYPGATSLRLETARDMIVDICRGLAHFGPRKFYVLNTGVSTVRALLPAQEILKAEGIRMIFTDLGKAGVEATRGLLTQKEGTHADEGETSEMLYIAPKTVDMSKAGKDFPARGAGPLQWKDAAAGRYSPSGIYGDATLATRKKGEVIVRARLAAIVGEIEGLRASR